VVDNVPVIDSLPTTEGFVDDIKASLAAWRKEPLLPIITVLLAIVSSSSWLHPLFGNWAAVIVLPVDLLLFGWLGTQFIWYQRAFEGRRFAPRELVPVTWSFVARYLGLYVFAFVPIFILFVILTIGWHTLAGLQSPTGRIGVLAYVLAIEVPSTFMAPALAFSTRKVTQSVPIGLRMLAHGWPGNWTYVVVPATVMGLLSGFYWIVPPPVRPGLEIIGVLALLTCAGAIARFYLRATSAPEPSQS
jgi:hypothetical protein